MTRPAPQPSTNRAFPSIHSALGCPLLLLAAIRKAGLLRKRLTLPVFRRVTTYTRLLSIMNHTGVLTGWPFFLYVSRLMYLCFALSSSLPALIHSTCRVACILILSPALFDNGTKHLILPEH